MLGLKTCTGKRDDEFFVYLSNAVITTSDEKLHKIEKLGKCDEYVYDVKTDSSFLLWISIISSYYWFICFECGYKKYYQRLKNSLRLFWL